MMMSRLLSVSIILAMALCLVQDTMSARNLQQQPSNSTSSSSPRVRKELRSLSSSEYAALLTGLRIMINTSTAAGQAKYGPLFKEYDHFIVKHAVASFDPRGDQGHNGPAFMSFHRAWLLELERSLLSVVPQLKALPYADFTFDFKNGTGSRPGKYYNTSESVFSNKYAGSIDCASGMANLCQVLDGAFPKKAISKFNNVTYAAYMPIYNGSLTTGLLRGINNNLTNPYLTRFGVKALQIDYVAFGTFSEAARFWFNPVNGEAAGVGYGYSQQDYMKCTNATAYANWMEWNYCADFTSYVFEFNNSKAWERYNSGLTSTLHAGIHWIVGGQDNSLLATQGVVIDGDMKDTNTSPNEVLLFMLHHANIDRQAMMWQANAQKRNATLASTSVMWGFPASYKEYPYSYNGTYLHDVITSNFPFSDIFNNQTGNCTHFMLLNNTRPGNSLYTYDMMA